MSPFRTWTGRRCCRGRCPLPSSLQSAAKKTSVTLTRSLPPNLRCSRLHVSPARSPAKTRTVSGTSITSLTSASGARRPRISRNVGFRRLRGGFSRSRERLLRLSALVCRFLLHCEWMHRDWRQGVLCVCRVLKIMDWANGSLNTY